MRITDQRRCRCRAAFAAAWCAFSVSAFADGPENYDRISMGTAVSIALDNNPKIIQYRERLLEKKCDVRATAGNFMPQVSLNAGYSMMNEPLTMDLDPIRSAMISLQASTMTKMATDSLLRATGGALPPALVNAFRQQYGAGANAALEAAIPHFIDTLKEQRYPNANITVVQPLFMGGKLVGARKAAVAEERGAVYEQMRIRNEVVRETFNDYCAIALLKNVVAVRKDVLDGMQKHERDAQSLCETGTIPRTNLLRARVAVAEAKRALADDENRLLLATLSLAKSLNLPDTLRLGITDTLSSHQLEESCEAYLAAADTLQPLLNYIRTRRDAARAKVLVDHAAMLPRIAAFGRYELFPDYLSALEPEWAAGVTLSLDLFTGGKRYQQLSSTKHLVNETESLIESAGREIRLWVRKAYIECASANARYAKLITDEALAAENLRQCRSRFASGYGTAIDVIDAELALEKNRIDRITALYDFHRSFMDLYTAIGKPENAIAGIFPAKEPVQ